MSPSDNDGWTAIVLAGQRKGEKDFAHSLGYAAKALIPVAGEPMLGRVVKALLDAPSVSRIIILAQEPRLLVERGLAWIATHPSIRLSAGEHGISHSILAIAGSDVAPWPLLIVTADHALLTAAMVESFIAAIGDTDAAVAVVERKVVKAAYPETRRTWLKFSDGAFSGANLFALRTPRSRRAAEVWADVEHDRKKGWKLVQFFGLALATRALTRTISLRAAIASAAGKAGFTCAPVRLAFAEAAIDVDKLEDLHLVERIVARSNA